jgi:hypothetical protein
LQQLIGVAQYNVAEWTTASFYTIGSAYEEFCGDILKSPAPQGLSEEELDKYWEMINQQWVMPLQTEALKYYQTNEKLALENNLNNDWIKKTKLRQLYLNEKLANLPDSTVQPVSTHVVEKNTTPNKKL